MVIVGAGIAVLAGGFFMVRDFSNDPGSLPHPAKQVTFTMPDGGTQTLSFSPVTPEARVAVAARLADFETRWNGLADIIRTTPRTNLAGPVKDQQALAREGKRIELTECLEPGRVFWSAALDAEVAFVQSFMTDGHVPSNGATEVDRHYVNWKKVEDACR